MPTPMPTVTVPPVDITPPTPVYNNYTVANNQPNYALANTALQLLKTIWQNRRKNDLSDSTIFTTGENRIFTREDLAQMSQEEFDKNEKAIMAQVRDFKGTMPTNEDMRRETLSGGVVYVNPYTRSDGTEVKGYYRSRPKF